MDKRRKKEFQKQNEKWGAKDKTKKEKEWEWQKKDGEW